MQSIFRSAAGLFACLSLASCYGPGMMYPGGGYGGYEEGFVQSGGFAQVPYGGYADPGFGGFGGYAPVGAFVPIAVARPWGGGWGGGGWGGGGWGGGGWGGGGWGGGGWGGGNQWNRAACSRCNRNPCGCAQTHHASRSSSGPQYRVVAGNLGTKTKPQGFHSEDWYRSRGYPVNQLKLQRDDGKILDRRPSSSSSSNSRSSSASKSNSSSSSKSKPSGSGSSGRTTTASSKSSSSAPSHAAGRAVAASLSKKR